MENVCLSGPNTLRCLQLQLLISVITSSAGNVWAISIGFLLVSLVTNRVSLEEVCLPSFEVLNCWLDLAASCFNDENEIPLNVIVSLSAVRFALPSNHFGKICLASFVSVYVRKCVSGCIYSILTVQVRWGVFCGGCLACSSHLVSLPVQVPRGVCGIQ